MSFTKLQKGKILLQY